MNVFIPIKEQSERVLNKNFRQLNGIPLWKHCVKKLNKYKVYIDTDSDKIIKECQIYNNVTAYKRDNKLLGHNTPVTDLIKNFINKFDINLPICQIHVTSPFLNTKHINQSFDILLHTDYDSVFSVTKTQKRFWDKDYKPINHDPKILLPTQRLDPWFEENSYLYTFWPKVINNFNNRIGDNSYMMEIGHPYNLDIDTEDDWDYIKNYNINGK
tara:strand:- start:135 stop:773 length:639 start_codon:yes stop_codon:yes gene_type:complete